MNKAAALPTAAPRPRNAPRAGANAPVSLHIERVVLDGFAFGVRERAQLQAALQSELGSLLTQRGLSPALRAGTGLPRLQAGELRMDAARSAAQWGQAIAHALFERMGP